LRLIHQLCFPMCYLSAGHSVSNEAECKREGGFCIIAIGNPCRFPYGFIGKCSWWKFCCKK
uniref:Uncharacterized protein n=1 Tax=Varanus komodoensis TaxID=61221 RepID=A0A8D2JDQ5_VARKO